MRVQFQAWLAVVGLLGVLGEARAQDMSDGTSDDAEANPPVAWRERVTLTPPALLREVAPRPPAAVDLGLRSPGARPHALRLTLDQSASVLRLAVHGDYRPGLSPFLGTSTASLGGFRLRF